MKMDHLDDLIKLIGEKKVDACFIEYFLALVHDSEILRGVKQYLENNKNVKKEELEEIINKDFENDDFTF